MKASYISTATVAADGARPGPAVSYSWTADGEPERCRVDGRGYAGEVCYHCRRPIEGRGVRLRADDGDEYGLHAECAREGCAARDEAAIDAALSPLSVKTEDGLDA